MNLQTCSSDFAEQDEAFVRLIYTLCRNLHASSLESLKYHCQDHIGKGKLEKIKTVDEVFKVLEQRDVISSEKVDFLASYLKSISRTDLLGHVDQFVNDWLRSEKVLDEGDPLATYSGKEHELSEQAKESTSAAVVRGGAEKEKNSAIPISGLGQQVNREIPSIRLIEFMANNLTFNWQETVRRLGVPDDIIEVAQYNNPSNIRQQIFDTLVDYERYEM